MTQETTLEMVSRHVVEGEGHVAKQEQIVTDLDGKGHDTRLARELLEVLNVSLAQHREHLEQLQPAPRPAT